MSFHAEMADWFTECLEIFSSTGGNTLQLTYAGQSAPIVANAALDTRLLTQPGYLPELAQMVNIRSADFTRLALRDRAIVTVSTKYEPATAYTAEIVSIENDPADPITTLRLKADR